MNEERYAELIEEHYARIWSAPAENLKWGKGPTDELPKHFSVLGTRRSSTVLAYSTRGMSLPSDPEKLEVYLLAEAKDGFREELVELLTAVAHFHRTGKRLWLGHTVNFGRPWLPNSLCTHGILSLPYLDGPALEWMEEPRVRFLWLVPITASEVEFKKLNGMDALEARFESVRFNYLDPRRAAVV